MDRALYEEALQKVNANSDPETLTHADTLKALEDAFTGAQVDNLVKELQEWASKAKKKPIVYFRMADLELSPSICERLMLL